jgi:Flp pilus assembly protein TadG
MAALKPTLLRRLVRSDAGSELIEFGLTLPLLLLLVLGMFEFGFMLQEYEVLTNAAREGARVAALPTYSATDTARVNNATARINDYLTAGGLTASSATKCVGNLTPPTAPGTGCAGAAVTAPLAAPATGCVSTIAVTVSYPHSVIFVRGIFSLFGGSLPATKNLSATAQMRTEAAAGTCP